MGDTGNRGMNGSSSLKVSPDLLAAREPLPRSVQQLLLACAILHWCVKIVSIHIPTGLESWYITLLVPLSLKQIRLQTINSLPYLKESIAAAQKCPTFAQSIRNDIRVPSIQHLTMLVDGDDFQKRRCGRSRMHELPYLSRKSETALQSLNVWQRTCTVPE